MPHLDSIIIHNFKSFKHVNIKFSKGFNCIVGANGSGKSNIADSLLFALGESSLSRMRVPNTSQLINSFAKPKKEDGVKRAYVKINFSGSNPLEIARIIKSSNKIGYRLNGKHVTKQEVIEALRSYRSEINETNIIAQGEISYLVDLNPKKRRELIDIASGIKEFDDKKETAMKELEKVEIKMNDAQIVINERRGFLNQLEKEKEDAEKYLQLQESIKRISYTLLKGSEKQVEGDLNNVVEILKGLEEKKKHTTTGVNEIDLMVEKLSKDKETLTKNLNERSVELGNTNRMLENFNKDSAVKETEIKSLKEKMDELEKQTAELKADQSKMNSESAEAKKQAELLQQELGEKSKQLTSKEALEVEGSGESQINKISQNQKRIDELYIQTEGISKQHLQYKFEAEGTSKSIKGNDQAIAIKGEEYDKVLKSIKNHNGFISESDGRIGELIKEIEIIQANGAKQQKTIDDLYVQSVTIREQISLLGVGSDKVKDLLQKNIDTGFYGRAYELCTYDDKYAFAINAAAMSRLSYFVVESAEVAEEAIKLLKARNLGRASFIPIKDLTTKYKEENKDLDRLIDHVKFDKKFDRAFSYIFANTYLVGSIKEAKSAGFGRGRFVTLEGELVEQSGIVTGGSTKQFYSPALLESKLKGLDEKSAESKDALTKLNLEIEKKRKEIAAKQVEQMGFKSELKHLSASSDSLGKEIESLKARTAELKSKLSQSDKLYADLDSKRNLLLDELNALKDENEKIYAVSSSSTKQKSKVDKTDVVKLKSLRSEVEELKIKYATLSKEQELKSARLLEFDTQIKTKNNESKETRKKLAILDSELLELQKGMKDIKEKHVKSDANSQELYKKIQDLDSKLTKLGTDKGKYQAELEKASRDSIEQEGRKSQFQTRMNDIKAELLSYQKVEIIKGSTQAELETKRTVDKSDLERLGAVNLKAPEVFETKKKDVEEANLKLEVLSNEKNSIVGMINEIESKKLNIFTETLNYVNENFKRLYSYIFDGSAALQLENPKDPFNSGLAITINSPKNKNSTVEALSGGEKTLVVIALIFAIQSHNPMSLYVFDEIDAALDKENSKKLSKLMSEVSKKSQLIVISHNDSLITAADTAIGVVHRNGESKVVGLELTPAPPIEVK